MKKITVEETESLKLDYQKLANLAALKRGLLPVVVQDAVTEKVLLLAYANEEALNETIRRGVAVFWSASRNCLWVKGESSGNFLPLTEIRVNCEQNSLLYRVEPLTGAVCHTQERDGQYRATCFYRRLRYEAKNWQEKRLEFLSS